MASEDEGLDVMMGAGSHPSTPPHHATSGRVGGGGRRLSWADLFSDLRVRSKLASFPGAGLLKSLGGGLGGLRRPFSAQSGFLDASGVHNNARVVVKILGYEVIEHQDKFVVSFSHLL